MHADPSTACSARMSWTRCRKPSTQLRIPGKTCKLKLHVALSVLKMVT